MVFLAMMLLVGFLMPFVVDNYIAGRRQAIFANLTILNDADESWESKLICLSPGIAGVVLLFLQALARHPVRGIVMVALALLPGLVLMSNEHVRESMKMSITFLPGDILLIQFLMLVAPVALLAGIRSRMYRPDSAASYWFGVAGAAAWFALLILPVLPSELGLMFLLVPLKMIGQPDAGGPAMGLIVLIVCTTISGVMCILNRPSQDMLKAAGSAAGAFWTLAVGFFVGFLCIIGQVLNSFPGFVAVIKLTCWLLGMYLLLPSGIADLIIGHPHHHPHHEHHESHEVHEVHDEPMPRSGPRRRVV